MTKIKDVLIVDDDPDFRNVLCRLILRRIQVEIHTAHDGDVAKDMLAERKFDCLITDTNMPNMDGVQLISHCRKEYPAMIKVILFGSSSKYVGLIETDLRALGADEVFEKSDIALINKLVWTIHKT